MLDHRRDRLRRGSALCGATPTGAVGEAWIIVFRVAQGAFAALLFPAALAIVVRAFPLRERGRALAAFFGITGALTAVGPLAGGYLTEWTWRAIFWINVPVAMIALILTIDAKPAEERRAARIDYRGARSSPPAWAHRPRPAAGRRPGAGPTSGRSGRSSSASLLLAAFVVYELRRGAAGRPADLRRARVRRSTTRCCC